MGDSCSPHGVIRQVMKDGAPVDILISPEKSRKLSDEIVKVFPEHGGRRLGSITAEQAEKAVRNGLAVNCSARRAGVRLTSMAEYIPRVGNDRSDMLIHAAQGGLCASR
jgi:hypothetical protein